MENAFAWNIDVQPKRSYEDQQTEITHQAHVMTLRRAKKLPILRMCRDLLEDNGGGLGILHERRLDVTLLLKALGIASCILSYSKPCLELS
jgi:hypothetical protein